MDYTLATVALINVIIFTFVVFTRRFNRAGLIHVGYYIMVITGLLGSVISLNAESWWLRYTSERSLYEAALYYNFSLLFFGVACIICKDCPIKPDHKLEFKENATPSYKFITVVIAGLFFVLIFPASPLYKLVFTSSVSSFDLVLGRGELTSGEGLSLFHIYFKNIFMRYVYTFLYLYFYIRYLITKRDPIFTFLTISIGIMISLHDLSKMPFLTLMAGLLVCNFIYGYLKYKVIVFCLAFTSLTLIAIYFYVFDLESDLVANVLLDRIFLVQYVGLPVTWGVFPAAVPHLSIGEVMGVFSKLLGYESQFYSRITMYYVNDYGVENGTAGYLSTFFGAEGYAVGGRFGYILVCLLLLVLFRSLEFFRNRKLSADWHVFYVLLILTLPRMVMDSFSSIVLNYGLYVTFAMIIILKELVRSKTILKFNGKI